MFLKKSLIILVGSILIAVGINFFIVPFHLLDGGAIGISLILHYLFDIRVGVAIIFISIPIFFLAWVNYRTYFYNGIHGLLFSSLIIDFLYPLHIAGEKLITNWIMGAICGGVFVGWGIGIMLRSEITIGGTDLLAQMMSKFFGINPGLCILSFDVLIVTTGSLLLETVSLFYSGVTVLTVGITTSLLVRK